MFLTFLALDIAFLVLGAGYLDRVGGLPHPGLIRAGGAFGMLSAFLAFCMALAGLLDESNRYVTVSVRKQSD